MLILLTTVTHTSAIESLQGLLGENLYSRLESRESLRHTFKTEEPLELFPSLPIKAKIITEIARLKPTVGVEYLLMYNPAIVKNRNEEPDDLNHLRIYNILRSVSTLKGIEYFSASRGRMRTFFYDAYAIESPKDRRPLSDPLVKEIPINSKLFAFLKDSSLGDYVAEVDYHYHYDYFSMHIRNLTTLWRFIFPILKPGELNMMVIIVPFKGEYLLYGLAYVNAEKMPGLAESKTASFYNRLKAFFSWFQTNLER